MIIEERIEKGKEMARLVTLARQSGLDLGKFDLEKIVNSESAIARFEKMCEEARQPLLPVY